MVEALARRQKTRCCKRLSPEVVIAGGAIVLVLAGRALSIYPLAALFRASRWKLSAAYQHTLFWGGLRGGLSVALALGVPAGAHRDTLLAMTYAVVCFAILVQGLTLPRLLRALEL